MASVITSKSDKQTVSAGQKQPWVQQPLSGCPAIKHRSQFRVTLCPVIRDGADAFLHARGSEGLLCFILLTASGHNANWATILVCRKQTAAKQQHRCSVGTQLGCREHLIVAICYRGHLILAICCRGHLILAICSCSKIARGALVQTVPVFSFAWRRAHRLMLFFPPIVTTAYCLLPTATAYCGLVFELQVYSTRVSGC